MDRSQSRVRSSPLHAFTLIECLAVVSIITMLTGIALTAFGKARHVARGVACQATHRSLVQAINLYYNEIGDLPTTTQHIVNVPANHTAIVDMLAPYHDAPRPEVGIKSRPWVCPNDPVRYLTTGGTYIYYPAGLWVNYGTVPPRHNLRSLLNRNPRMRMFLDGMPIHNAGYFMSTFDGAVEPGSGPIVFSL